MSSHANSQARSESTFRYGRTSCLSQHSMEAKQLKSLAEAAKATSSEGANRNEFNFVAQEITVESDAEFWTSGGCGNALKATENVTVFKVDSGATSNFGNEEVTGTEEKACNVIVEQADGTPIHVHVQR